MERALAVGVLERIDIGLAALGKGTSKLDPDNRKVSGMQILAPRRKLHASVLRNLFPVDVAS